MSTLNEGAHLYREDVCPRLGVVYRCKFSWGCGGMEDAYWTSEPFNSISRTDLPAAPLLEEASQPLLTSIVV